jgi:3-deoxy-manno-octulosonate cytidylyltransferase (CMP-KDO synthetase)
VVKVVCDNENKALYFSRAPIPFHHQKTDTEPVLGFAHVGLYAYTKEALLRFAELQPTNLEQREGLEQLRALENGMVIEMIQVEKETLSIDTNEDYNEARTRMGSKND